MPRKRFVILLVTLCLLSFTQILSSARAEDLPTESLFATYSGGYQRVTFYASSRYWLFYGNDSGEVSGTGRIVYRTSTDGETWTDASTVYASDPYLYGIYFSTWFDGKYLHWICRSINSSDSNDLIYRRGFPESDGSITWSAALQNVADMVGWPGTVCNDSQGYVWVAFNSFFDGVQHATVIKNAVQDGTWSNATGSPYFIANSTGPVATNTTAFSISLIPLTGGKIYAIYYNQTASLVHDHAIRGRLWNTTHWEAEETITTDPYHGIDYGGHSAVADGDIVHAVYGEQNNYAILHRRRIQGTGWEAANTIVSFSSSGARYPVLGLNATTGDLYCFWANQSKYIYYKIYDNASTTWRSYTNTWINETAAYQLFYTGSLSCFRKDWNGKMALTYTVGTADPYVNYVRFAPFTGQWILTYRARDSSGNLLTISPVLVNFTFPNGTNSLVTLNNGETKVLVDEGTLYHRVRTQGQWVSGNTSTSLGDGDPQTVTKNCSVYKATVYVAKEGAVWADERLRLYRNGELLNNMYGLPADPRTNSSGYYTWSQLANQSSSYEVETVSAEGSTGDKTLTGDVTKSNAWTIEVGETGAGGGGGGGPGGPMTYTLKVFVVNAETGQSVSDTRVTLADSQAVEIETKDALNGEAVFSGLPAARYVLYVKDKYGNEVGSATKELERDAEIIIPITGAPAEVVERQEFLRRFFAGQEILPLIVIGFVVIVVVVIVVKVTSESPRVRKTLGKEVTVSW